MNTTVIIVAVLILLALALIHARPSDPIEGFAVASVDPVLMPACVERSVPAQALLARLASGDDDAAELRLLVSKLCCLEADVALPAGKGFRTHALQFRTSHDMEDASALASRCRVGAVRNRDIELVVDKFTKRGHLLISRVFKTPADAADATREFDGVVFQTRASMIRFCLTPQPTMDHPLGARDLAFWEPASVAGLDQYQGISAVAK